MTKPLNETQKKLLERVRREGVAWARSISETRYQERSRLYWLAASGHLVRHDAGGGQGIYYTLAPRELAAE